LGAVVKKENSALAHALLHKRKDLAVYLLRPFLKWLWHAVNETDFFFHLKHPLREDSINLYRKAKGSRTIGTDNRDRRAVFRYLFWGWWQAITRRSIRKESGLALQTRAQHAAPLQVSRFSLSSGGFQAGKWGPELASGEGIEGAEAATQLDVAQAAVAVERAYKLDGVALGLQ